MPPYQKRLCWRVTPNLLLSDASGLMQRCGVGDRWRSELFALTPLMHWGTRINQGWYACEWYYVVAPSVLHLWGVKVKGEGGEGAQ